MFENMNIHGDSGYDQKHPHLVVISRDQVWKHALSSLMGYRTTETTDQNTIDFLKKLSKINNDIDLILVDASSISESLAWVRLLAGAWPKLRVAVATLNLEWEKARQYFKEGAIDYFFKTKETRELERILEAALKRQPLGREERFMREARIFYYDNREDDLDRLRDTLALEDYEIETFLVRNIEDVKELKRQLDEGWWHLVIADIALLDERPDGDAIGLEIASQIDASIPTIIWTAYPNVERIQRALTQGDEPAQRRAFDFVSKREISSNTKLLKSIRRALQTGEHAINLDLQIDCQSGFSFVSLVGRFIPEKENPSITRVELAQSELRDVYRKLFLDNNKIYLGQLPHHRPETVLTCVWPEGEGVTQVSLVVECGLRSVIRSIRYNWEKFIQPYLQGLAVHFERSAETRHFAGVVYRLSEPVETFQSFREFYRTMPAERVIEIIRSFFEVCCARWYQTAPHVFTQSLDQVYLREFGLAGREEELDALLRNRLWRHPLSLNRHPRGPYQLGWTKGKVIELHHPLEVIQSPPQWLNFPFEHHSAITHGNLNGDTLLISPQGRFWILGDPSTGYGYILRDLASLEATIVLELTQGAKPDETMLAFRAWLSPQSFEEPFQMAGLTDEYRKALMVAGELRKQAASLNSPQIGYYYFALMMHVAALLLRNTFVDNQSLVLAWALLANRIQTFPDWEPALTGRVGALRLDENRRGVYVPWAGRWEDLTLKEFDLLTLLTRHPSVLITWEQINEAAWGKGAQVSADMRDQLVRRLREKIEQDPRQPRYIVTRKGIGLVFDPSGG